MNLGEYSVKKNRLRDKELDDLYRKDHDFGSCGGVENYCHICLKSSLFKFISDIIVKEKI